MQTSVKTCFQKIFTIDGRASRSEYWWFSLFIGIINVLLNPFLSNFPPLISPLLNLWEIIIFIPLICVTTRRLHDINVSGWWQLCYYLFLTLSLMLVPLYETTLSEDLGFLFISGVIFIIAIAILIVGLVFLCIKGTTGDNRFGADPLAEENPH